MSQIFNITKLTKHIKLPLKKKNLTPKQKRSTPWHSESIEKKRLVAVHAPKINPEHPSQQNK